MERPTKTFTTTLGNKAEIKTYLTQGERSQVQRILAGDSTVSENPTQKTNDLLTALEKALTLSVVSLNDNVENVTDRIVNELPASEYDEISAEVLKLIALDLQKAK